MVRCRPLGFWTCSVQIDSSRVTQAEGKKQLQLVRKVGYPVDEFMGMYSKALQKYVWFRFVGTYMDATIKPVFADLPRGKFACAADYSEVFALEPLEQLQSQYYSTRTVRILVIVSVRHAVFELDK